MTKYLHVPLRSPVVNSLGERVGQQHSPSSLSLSTLMDLAGRSWCFGTHRDVPHWDTPGRTRKHRDALGRTEMYGDVPASTGTLRQRDARGRTGTHRDAPGRTGMQKGTATKGQLSVTSPTNHRLALTKHARAHKTRA
jgi:hypothetical protein